MDNPLDSEDPQAAKPSAAPAPRPLAVDATKPIAEAAPEPKGAKAVKPRKKRGNAALIAVTGLVGLVLIGGAGWLAWNRFGPQLASGPSTPTTVAQQAQGPLAIYAKGSMTRLVTLAQPQPIENMAFIDRDRKPVHLADFKGQVVVLNLWATWCTPCRVEMPTLAKLQSAYAGKALKVLPLSGDSDDKLDDVKSFIDVQDPLQVYMDPDLITKTGRLNISGLPATLILNKEGQIVARIDGEAAWDTADAKALIDKLLSE